MATKNYNTRTASLRATIADVRVLDAKKMNLDGKNILDYISDSEFDSYDTRDPQLKNDELDIWNTAISLSDNGHIEVKPFEHTYNSISSTQSTTIKSAVKVIDNEVLGADEAHLMYWQTDGLMNGYQMFSSCTNLNLFTSDLSSLTDGNHMFHNCSNLNSFTSDLSSLTDGSYMFSGCTNLTTFTSDLPSLTHCYQMFASCTKLTSFSSDLSSLTDGDNMFYGCTKLTSFNSDLSSLTDGNQMFSGCSLTTFSSDLSSLTDGNHMFYNCENLTSFNSDLSSLTDGGGMFYNCKLDAQSVANIVHTLPTHESIEQINIGIGCDATEADQLLFAQECDCETWQELLDEFSAKNWTVTFQCKGRPTEVATYGMRRGATLPVYTKLEEVTESEQLEEVTESEHYAYTSQDGSKFYNINYFHSTNGSTEGYDVFSSLEEAISTYNVTPKN